MRLTVKLVIAIPLNHTVDPTKPHAAGVDGRNHGIGGDLGNISPLYSNRLDLTGRCCDLSC